MLTEARRLPARGCYRFARRALLAVCLWPTWAGAQDLILQAQYADPTPRYAHAVLGDAIEYGTLLLTLQDSTERRFVLPQTSVFEDTEPRLVDVTGDGTPEVITVESAQSQGARLAIYNAQGRLAATPYIGTRFRWLAPLGAADLDGDGFVELAYVDRPHLAKTLRIWRFVDNALVPVAERAGFTNHRIGEEDIAGGIRTCNARPEMVLARANWSELVALRLVDGAITTDLIGTDTSRAGFARAMRCDS